MPITLNRKRFVTTDALPVGISSPKARPSVTSISENDGNINPSCCYLPHERNNCYAFIQGWGFDGESASISSMVAVVEAQITSKRMRPVKNAVVKYPTPQSYL
nr:hypothetical transcript [Hymenolepis microstoma]